MELGDVPQISSFSRICRTCLQETEVDTLFPIHGTWVCDVPVLELLESCVYLKVDKKDLLPQGICEYCIQILSQSHEFKQRSQDNDQILRSLINVENTDSDNVEFEEEVTDSEEHTHGDIDVKEESSEESMLIPIERTSFTENQLTCKKLLNRPTFESQLEFNSQDNDKILRSLLNVENTESVNIVEGKVEAVEVIDSKHDQDQFTCKSCPVCPQFKSLSEFTKHKKRYHYYSTRTRVLCETCGQTVQKSLLSNHIRSHTGEKPFECNVCHKRFSVKHNLLRHEVIHTGEQPYMCSQCGKCFNRQDLLKTHTDQVHLKKTKSSKQGTEIIKPYKARQEPLLGFKCKYCGRGFQRYHFYQSHLEIHRLGSRTEKSLVSGNEVALHRCDFCSKGFKTAHLLNLHKNRTHAERKFLCPQCGRDFTSSVRLRSHSRVHTDERPFFCPTCNKRFKRESTLFVHMALHTGVKLNRCSLCQMSFTQGGHLKRHMLIHTGERPHACSVCKRTFALKGNLKVHIRTHTGETPYTCDQCEKGFYDSSSLKRHKRKCMYLSGEDQIQGIV